MYDQFRWTRASVRRNALTIEYEPVQPFFLMALAKKAQCETFIDVGANIGAYSLFCTLIPTIKKIIAFEANPDTIKELNRNIALNNLINIIDVHGKAVSSGEHNVSFGVVSKFSGANGVIDTTIHELSKFYKKVIVEAISLDGILKLPFDTPLCIKIDVEGHEREVLDGAKVLLNSHSAVIQIEGYENSNGSAIKMLNDMGYFRLTSIGPDQYYSNISFLRDKKEVIELYEQAIEQMISYNHRNKSIVIKFADIGIQLTGKSANIAINIARRLIGRHF